jgi:hypothetical protein
MEWEREFSTGEEEEVVVVGEVAYLTCGGGGDYHEDRERGR